jgi:tetratricopeptide (TPR) repeat protein
MTDPLRSDPLHEAGEVPERDREARIEGLLLAGLDHYFVGQYELAISVWTRVLFLDRGHARAKAYIDRARSAVAERQREGEELLHTGAAAFDRGDARAARRLLKSAVERGAGGDEAAVLLERLDRLEHANTRPAPAFPNRPRTEDTLEPTAGAVDKPGSSRIVWIATGVLAGLAAAAIVAWIALSRPEWLPVGPPAPMPSAAQSLDPLPVPGPSEIGLARARSLYDQGRVREALRAIETIGYSDPLRPEADELKATMQRTLLDASRARPGQR